MKSIKRLLPMDKISRFKVDIMAQGSEFYVSNIFRDRVALTAKGYSDISTWSDLEL
jgi:hypothetical protein